MRTRLSILVGWVGCIRRALWRVGCPRAARLTGASAHRENPRSRTRRFVSNVRVEEKGEGELSVSANVLVYRFRGGEAAPYVGAIDYILRPEGEALKIAHRRAVLDLESLSWHGAVSIIF